ncbi:MAG: hypothetical protein HOO96_03425 [Polyangiaceae bacterium]|nr:hypothetical protein [Polyangiaceae bacterium]
MERSSKTLVALLTLAMGVGCNSLLGLDGYSGASDAGTDGGNGGLDGAVDGGADVIVVPPTVRPASWPNWIMPNEPDSGVDNKAVYASDGQDITVVAAPSGVLKFLSNISKASTLDEAVSKCPTGYRLPSRIELITLLDYRTSRGSVMPDLMPSATGLVWTASIRRPATNPLMHWFVDASSGAVVARPPQSANVLCIVSKQ